MSIDDEVDNILYGKKEPRISTRNKIIMAIVMLCLGGISVIPILQRKEGEFHVSELLVDELNKNRSVFGNESMENESAYHYWYAPDGSFGIQELKTVNWSHFWKLFGECSAWQLEAWHPVQEIWVSEWQGTNLNEWLNITRVRNETTNGSEKITLNVTNNHPTQSLYFRFTFGIDLRVKQFVNKSSNYEYELTYPANATENYTVFFNFSDVKPLIQSGLLLAKHGVTNKTGTPLYFFRLTQNMSRNPLPNGSWFEIDPRFGNQDIEATNWQSSDDALYTNYSSPASDGTVDYGMGYFRCQEAGDVALHMYFADNLSKVDNGQSDTLTLGAEAVFSWHNFTWSAPKPNIKDEFNYIICLGTTSGNCKLLVDTSAGDSGWDKNCFYGGINNFPDPLVEDNAYTYTSSMYVMYTESAAPGKSWQSDFSGYFTGGNVTTWSSDFSGYFTGGNDTVTVQQDFTGYFTGGNDTVNWQSDFNNWFTGGNITTWVQDFTGYFTGGNITNWQPDFDGYFTGGNETVSWNEDFSGWFEGGNTTPAPAESWQQDFTGWFTGGNTSAEVITVYPGVYFDIENDMERYGVNQTMNFSQIIINESWIMFNTTDFNITAPNFINISLTVIDSSPLVSVVDDLILGFWANSTGGTVWFNISGFESNADYYVMKDGVNFTNCPSNATGIINFSDTVDDNYLYEIFNGSIGKSWQSDFTGYFTGGNATVSWTQDFTGWFSGGNTTPPPPIIISNEYPANQSFIYDLQPTVFFTLSHGTGNLMNYSVFTGVNYSDCTHLLASAVNVSNGTYNCNEYYNATNYSRYYYRVVANDGTEWVNESLWFNCSTEPQMISGNGLSIGVAMAASMLAIGFIFIFARRRRDGVS